MASNFTAVIESWRGGLEWAGLGWDGVGLLFWILLGASTKPPATAVLIINGYLPMKNYFYILGFIFPE